jgi:hypothetical protein
MHGSSSCLRKQVAASETKSLGGGTDNLLHGDHALLQEGFEEPEGTALVVLLLVVPERTVVADEGHHALRGEAGLGVAEVLLGPGSYLGKKFFHFSYLLGISNRCRVK